MKKTIIALAAVVGLAATGYSQGSVSFDDVNINSGVVTYLPGPSTLSSSANYNYTASFTIQLWYIAAASAPTAASEGANSFGYLTESQFLGDTYTLGATTSSTSPGTFNFGSSVPLTSTTGGSPALLALVAWTGAYTSLTNAVENSADVGIITFQNPTAAPLAASVPELTGWDALTQTAASAAYASSKTVAGASDLILSPVPEPTTLALIGLGGASLVAYRRRKA